ncbi:MAG: sugar ABC transporter ATP-binding protein [Planctomycetes bacterium]|nr:sugar ABC transporter ATP-binding protein [Planctomycetota bacterium]MBL7145494.1 sugar ABC transporter ATP-binding protein [Phycisphaerae bacterium]
MAERVEPDQSAIRLQMQGVCKRFGATIALEDVSIKVASGQVLALVGENGAGKSTLMKVCSGAIKPDTGQMQLDGKPYQPGNPLEARRAGVAMIYQELSLTPHLSVEENIMLGMEPATLGVVHWKKVRQRAIEAIKEFDNPELTPDARVSNLSVGSQQLVEIARALAIGCRVLVLDEPTSSLTRQDVERLFEIIGRLKQQGKAIVYISHFIEEVKRIADKVTVLRDGRVVGGSVVDAISIDEIVALMVGRQVEELYPRSEREAGEVILEIEDLAGPQKPVSASLKLRRGEVLGIAGLVGAGRTELLRSLFGLEPVKRGRIRLGVYTGPASPVRRWMQGAGLLSEDRKEEGLALSLSVADNITLSKLKGFGPLGLVLPGKQDKATRRWLERLDIRCLGPRQSVSSLSGGNQQKVAIARLLQHDVDVLLLDEPTRGIDVAAKALVYKLINELASGSPADGHQPKAVLIVSSYLPELMGVCDRVAVMCRGRLGPTYPIDEVDEHKLMLEATGQEINA